MADNSRRRNTVIVIIVVVLLLIALALLLSRCQPKKPVAPAQAPGTTTTAPVGSASATMPATSLPAATLPDEVLTPATVAVPESVTAGAVFLATWTGPNNPGDYITIVPKATPDGEYRAYRDTAEGSPLLVKAPKEAGDAEIRYMSGQGRKVLARIPLKVVP